jgi:hypothetical protein
MDLGDFLHLIFRSCVDGLRRNKIPAAMAALALVLTTALTLTSDFDERPRYRKFILPEIQKVEQQFFSVMDEAAQEPDESWRLRFFLEGHRRAKTALRVVSEERPMTPAGRKAQRELVRYYELVDEQLAIIRTEMSFNESYDYISEWKRTDAELMPIRERWLRWIQPSS